MYTYFHYYENNNAFMGVSIFSNKESFCLSVIT